MATHSSIPTWKISWTEEAGGLQSMGWQRLGYNLVTLSAHTHTHTHTHTELVHDLGPFCLLTWAMSHGSTGGRFNSSLQF